jgi:D-2-hydroxyacid dehydrogenase (NADP+)
MDKVNVLIVSKEGLPKDYLQVISSLDPRILAKDGIRQFVAELRRKGMKGRRIDILERQVHQESNQNGSQVETLDTMLAQAEVIFAAVLIPDDLFSRAPRLKWLHFGTTGLESYGSQVHCENGVLITNSRGCLAVPIAEHSLGFMFMLSKNAPRLLSDKENRHWERFKTLELRDRVVGIVGLGAIGTEIARLAKGIGMKVLAIKRSAERKESNVSGVDELYPRGELLQMLSESDFVVLAVPLTPETRMMFGEKEFRAMKPSSYLINISRGKVIDQPALIRSLKEGWIAGAGLDVFETEPLPADNELWDLPNVIISPHMSGHTDRSDNRILGIFQENLKRYLAGEELLNVIDWEKGY